MHLTTPGSLPRRWHWSMARFRAISSLQEIIVKMYEDGPGAAIRREMESHGWTIKVTRQAEELGFSGSFMRRAESCENETSGHG